MMSRKEMVGVLMLSPFYFMMTLDERRYLVNECLKSKDTFKKG